LKIKKLMKDLVLVKCDCGTLVKKNHVCPTCGTYKGKQVLTIKEKSVIEA